MSLCLPGCSHVLLKGMSFISCETDSNIRYLFIFIFKSGHNHADIYADCQRQCPKGRNKKHIQCWVDAYVVDAVVFAVFALITSWETFWEWRQSGTGPLLQIMPAENSSVRFCLSNTRGTYLIIIDFAAGRLNWACWVERIVSFVTQLHSCWIEVLREMTFLTITITPDYNVAQRSVYTHVYSWRAQFRPGKSAAPQ